jgi:hypothetical protein
MARLAWKFFGALRTVSAAGLFLLPGKGGNATVTFPAHGRISAPNRRIFLT